MASLVKAGLRLAVVLAVWFALSLWLGWDRLPIAPGRVTSGPNRGLEQLVGALWWLAAASIVSQTAKTGAEIVRLLDKRDRQRALRFTLDTIAIAVYLAALVSMSAFVFELPIATLFATSSLLAVVLGFALQATVADLLAGVALNVEQPFRHGDWITVDGRHHGRVTDMNWRATHIEQKNGDLLILPNNMLNRSMIVNHSLPKRTHRSSVDVMLHYTDAPEHTSEVLRAAVMSVPAVLKNPAPQIEVQQFGEGTITYRLKYWIGNMSDEASIESRVRHAAWRHVSWAGFEWPTFRYVNGVVPQRNGAPNATEKLDELLGRMPLFAPLDAAEREQLARGLRLQRVKANARIIRKGEEGRSLFIIREGAFRVLIDDGSGEREVARLQPGDYVGEASLLTGAVRNATIEALTDAAVYEVDKDAIAPLIAARQSLADDLGAVMAERERAREETLATNGSPKPPGSLGQIASQIRAFFASS